MGILTMGLKFQTSRDVVFDGSNGQDMWPIALWYRILQAGLLVFVGWSFMAGSLWAKHDIPLPSVNSCALLTDEYKNERSAFQAGTTVPPYCDNEKYAHASSGTTYWNFTSPECRALNWQEIFEKDPNGGVYVTTTYVEEKLFGYPCGSTPAAPEAAACVANGASVIEANGPQCECQLKRTVVPVGVEKLAIGFGHSYVSTAFGGMEGSSTDPLGGHYDLDSGNPQAIGEPLEVRVLFSNFTDTEHPWTDTADKTTYSDQDQALPLKDWLAAGGVPDIDQPSKTLGADHYKRGGGTRRPMLRTAGVKLDGAQQVPLSASVYI